MKKIIYCSLALLAVLSGSCSKETDKVENVLPDMEINLTHEAFQQEVAVPSIDGESNFWHVYSPSADSWLVQEVVPGKNSIYVSADANTTGEIRSSYIVIRRSTDTQKIVVNQDYDGTIELSQTQLNMRYLLSEIKVNIMKPDDLEDVTMTVEYLTAGQDGWITLTMDGSVIKISGQANPTSESREARIIVSAVRKISGKEVSRTINVYQGRGGMTPYVFDIPDFSASKVYKVMAGNRQIAQVCKELIRKKDVVNQQAIVVYPVNEAGEVELTKGYVAQVLLESADLTNDYKREYTYAAPTGAVHGGSIAFSVEESGISSFSKGELAEPVTKVYMPGDVGMGPEEVPGSVTATVEPVIVEDVRGSETYSYPVAKIGTQYWLGENLKTAYYNSKKSFEAIPTNVPALAETPYVCLYGNNDINTDNAEAMTSREQYGALYSYLAISGSNTVSVDVDASIEDNISPEGWIVPTHAEFQIAAGYIVVPGAFGGKEGASDNNISGFGAVPGGYRSSAYTVSSTFYATYHTRTRASDSEGKKRSYNIILRPELGAQKSFEVEYRNRMNIERAQPVRCMNNGAIKVK